MNPEDQIIIDNIVASFGHKDIKPKRCLMPTLDKKDIYQCSKEMGCAIAVTLHGTPCIDGFIPDAARILGLPPGTVIGLTFGFDRGIVDSIGPEDLRGVMIGSAIADRVFPKVSRNKTII